MGADILEKTRNGYQTSDAIFRYAVISRIYGAEFDENVIPIRKLGDEMREKIDSLDFKRCTDDLLILFADGIIDENTLHYLLVFDTDIYEDTEAAKKYILDKSETSGYDKLSGEQIGELLKCCLMSQRSESVTAAGFDELREIMANTHITIYDGAVKITDKELLKFMIDAGEPTGVIRQSEKCIAEELKEYHRGKLDLEVLSPEAKDTPCVLDLKKFPALAWLFGKPYSIDFIRYAREKSISLDDVEMSYTDYLSHIKLHFEISGFKKKRSICQEIVNRFDYSDKAGDDVMTPEKIMVIDLEADEGDLNDEQLTAKAVVRFAGDAPLEESTVLKIVHGDSHFVYVVRNGSPVQIDETDFNTVLFDFNNIWTIVQELSHKGQIKMNGGRLFIPQEICEKIPKIERKYAQEMIKEQYRLNEKNKKSNRLLSVLKSDAQNAYRETKNLKAAQDNNAAKREKGVVM